MEQGNKSESKTDSSWSSPRLIQLGNAAGSQIGKIPSTREYAAPLTGGGSVLYTPSVT